MIERVGLGHAEAMAAIHAEAFGAGEAWSSAAFAGLLASPGCFGLIDPRGGLVLIRAAGGEAEVLTIGVVPSQRRQGRAGALLARAIEILREAGVSAVFLEVSEANAPAQALYGFLGFNEVARRPAYYGPQDAMVMRLSLDS